MAGAIALPLSAFLDALSLRYLSASFDALPASGLLERMWRAERRPPRSARIADTIGLRFSARHPLILRRAEGPSRRVGGKLFDMSSRASTARHRNSPERCNGLPLSPCGRARARITSAVRGQRLCRVQTKTHPLTLPAMRLASFAARSRRKALSHKGRGDLCQRCPRIIPASQTSLMMAPPRPVKGVS